MISATKDLWLGVVRIPAYSGRTESVRWSQGLANYPYVELERRFIDIGSSDPDDDQYASMLLSLRNQKDGVIWKELLKNDAAVILGSAGSGKTTEILQRAIRLRADGIPAFVLRLESLCRQTIEKSFSPADVDGPTSFGKWLKSGGQAVVFLDALDEARLPQAQNGSALADALSQLSSEVADRGKLLKVIITTRGSEWQGQPDFDLVNRRMNLLRYEKNFKESNEKTAIKVVRISSLDTNDIRLLAKARDIDAENFLSIVNKSLSANLMSQPLEAHFLIDLWLEEVANGRPPENAFSSRLTVFKEIVKNRLKSEQSGERRSNLDPTNARLACERLAAALAVSDGRDLSAIDNAGLTLNALDVLSNKRDRWTEPEVRQLLSNALFHPSAGGRVRFAHREIQDFLAASYFHLAISNDAGSLDIISPLISKGLGKDQIPQSTERLMGWLAALNSLGRRCVTNLRPSLLIETGDPTQLSNDERTAVLHSQVALYEDRKYRGEWFYRDDIKKFATADLSPQITKLLATAKSPELREFLVRVARYGNMGDLANQLCAIAIDQKEGLLIRAEASFALSDFANDVHRMTVLRAALLSKVPGVNDVDSAPAWNTHQLAALTYAYPARANLMDARKVLLRIQREAKNYSSITAQLLEEIVEKSPESDLPQWLSLLVQLAVGPRNKEKYFLPDAVPQYRCFAPVIGRIISELLKSGRIGNGNDTLLDALEYLFQFNNDLSISMHNTPLHDVAVALKPNTLLKRQLISRRIALFDVSKDIHHLSFGVTYPLEFGRDDKIPSIFSYEDVASYCEDVQKATSEYALHLAYKIANDLVSKIDDQQERNKAERAIYLVAKQHGDKEIRKEVNFSIKHKILRRWYRFKNIDSYRWRTRINRIERSISELYWRLRNTITFVRYRQKLNQGQHQGMLIWGAQQALSEPGRETIEAIRKLHGKIIANWFELGYRNFWRQCKKDSIKPNTVLETAGLVGLSLDAEAGPINATHDEALNAFRFAFGNSSGFPKWFPALLESHPTAFKEVYMPLILEVFTNAGREQDFQSEVLSKIAYSSVTIRSQVAPYIFELLQSTVPKGVTDLEISLQIIAKSTSIDGNSATNLFRSGFQRAAVAFDFVRAWSWLDAMFITNAAMAWKSLTEFIGNNWSGSSASLFLYFIGRSPKTFSRAEDQSEERNDLLRDVEVLSKMVRTTYLVFPPENDPRHEEVYSPELKDRAADARRYYLDTLVGMNSKAALEALDRLANDVELKNHRDAFLYQRDRLVRNSARRPIFNRQEAIEFLNGIGKSPDTTTEFGSLVERHIIALLTKLKESDDNEGRVFRKGNADENDLRNWLSARLRETGDRYWTCSREAEMASEKRTDIHVNARTQALGKIPVEIKLAERWLVPELIKKLRSQLFKQYMLEDMSHTGFYVVVNASKSNFRKRYKGSMISFEQLSQTLKTEAERMNSSLSKGKKVHIITISLVPQLS